MQGLVAIPHGSRTMLCRRTSHAVGRLLAAALLACSTAGCDQKDLAQSPPPQRPGTIATVRVVRPELRNLTHAVGQPGFIDAYEETAIYAKVSGFIKKFYVDIGDPVRKDELLVEIFVPELAEEHRQKVAQVALDQKMVAQAEQLVVLAQSNLQTAAAEVAQAQADLGKYEAEVVRWEAELKRFSQMLAEKVADQEVWDETRRQFDATKAARDAAKATIAARQAARVSAEAALGKAKIDVEAAQAKVQVSDAEAARAAALLAYTRVTAPYDGVVTVRNANTGDYVQAISGDRLASRAAAIFVVARTDLVRVYLDIPEAYAQYVSVGGKALIRPEALHGLEIAATVTRTSWSVHRTTRTLLAEIDLAIKDYPAMRPGMYVYGEIVIQRQNVRVLPESVVTVQGNQAFCYLVVDGRAVKTPLLRGVSEGPWVEVLRKKVGDSWAELTGNEEVVAGNLSEISDGQVVRRAAEKPS